MSRLSVANLVALYRDGRAWARKQKAAAPGRYYGGTGTIHGSELLNVEVHDGRVVAVWYRCQALPFEHVEVGPIRASEMRNVGHGDLPAITGVELDDTGAPW